MPSFQIRYIGDATPEPETVVAATAAEAVLHVRARLGGYPDARAMVLFEGSVIQTVSGDTEGPEPDEETVQRFASAGIYWFRDR